MSFRTLPPVGEKVILEGAEPPPEFTGFAALWTRSGTAALALAIQAAMAARPDVTSPEVLLPAYGCPDLVAAALYAGATPVLADVSREEPAYSIDALERSWTESVVAIVAVNFLGIREHVGRLAAFSRERNAWLIEDCAQWYPEAPESEPVSPAQAVIRRQLL